uniref:Tyrosyl-tRNA synthetase n=1 Tax=Oncorhynchus kisutch TaxID=8019 RepID=A0A8C7CSN0_ONCKI
MALYSYRHTSVPSFIFLSSVSHSFRYGGVYQDVLLVHLGMILVLFLINTLPCVTLRYRFHRSATAQSGFILSLNKRGILKDGFPEKSAQDQLPQLLQSCCQTEYCGFDPTADSLHVGNLLAIIGLLNFQSAGHTGVALIGGAALVGDPSERERATGMVAFLAEVGRHFRMGNLAEGMSLTEFSYQLFQAYDSYHLNQNHSCKIQLGGTDQLGNQMSGHKFIHKVTGQEVYGLTLPLVASSVLNKLGKTVWLNRVKTSPFVLCQFFLRQPVSSVEWYLKLFTFLPLAEVERVMEQQRQGPGKRAAHKPLAGKRCSVCTNARYHSNLQALELMRDAELQELFRDAPFHELLLEPGPTILDALGGPKEGTVWINHSKTDNPEQVLIPGQHILTNVLSLLRVGKNNFHVIRWLNL